MTLSSPGEAFDPYAVEVQKIVTKYGFSDRELQESGNSSVKNAKGIRTPRGGELGIIGYPSTEIRPLDVLGSAMSRVVPDIIGLQDNQIQSLNTIDLPKSDSK